MAAALRPSDVVHASGVDGTVYMGSNGWYLWAVDAATGEERWKQETGAAHQSSPAVADGAVYIGSEDQSLWAVDAITGEERWRLQTGGEVHATSVVADGTVYVSSKDDFLYAVHTVAAGAAALRGPGHR